MCWLQGTPGLAVTLQVAGQADTTTLDETLCEAGIAVAEQVGREAELRPNQAPQVNVAGIEETVTDKGYHSGAVVKRMKAYEMRSYIPEKKRKGRRNWAGRRLGYWWGKGDFSPTTALRTDQLLGFH